MENFPLPWSSPLHAQPRTVVALAAVAVTHSYRWLFVRHAHHPERVGGVAAQIVLGTEINHTLFVAASVIGSERVDPSFCGCFVDPNARKQPAGRFNPSRGRCSTLIRHHLNLKARRLQRSLEGDCEDLIVCRPIVGQNLQRLAVPRTAEPSYMGCKVLPL